MNESLHVCKQVGYTLGRRRHKGGIARARAAYPILRSAQFTWLLAIASNTVK